jgi:hypothetical protein
VKPWKAMAVSAGLRSSALSGGDNLHVSEMRHVCGLVYYTGNEI